MTLSPMQCEYINNATHRWNVKTGATRSGKTFMDIAFTIPYRLRQTHGKPGLRLLLGATKGTLTRNIIDPLTERWGTSLVSAIRSDNTATLFGEKVYCLGADNVRQVNRIRGASVIYCYGDEVTTWNEEVFTMLKSRLDKPDSTFDGTCNPEGPSHWFKKFIDSGADVYAQAYTIDDNPFLPASFVAALKQEYEGTVYFNRYILGQWMAAEGIVYRAFADDAERFIIDEAPPVTCVTIGVDFGGGTSAHAFSCVGFTRGLNDLVVLDEFYEKSALTPEKLEERFVEFVRRCQDRWIVADVWCDSAEQTLIGGLRSAAAKAHIGVNIGNARKYEVNDRIRCAARLMGADRFKIMRRCEHTIDAYRSALWDSKYETEDVRLDNGTTNIDSLDATEYAYERYIKDLIIR